MDLAAALQQYFGYPALRAGQEAVMRALLEGRSALALFPTGAGKSLCYQLPALLMDGVTLVISPLIALMKDQVESLKARGIAAARLDSSLKADEIQRVFQDLASGRTKLLYIAPERLMNENFIERLKGLKIAMMAVDEAHCISEWGHNFRPEYLRLALVARELGIRPVLALTATATPAVASDIRIAFGIEERDHIQTSFQRPNLQYRVNPCPVERKKAVLAGLLKEREGASIVYVTLQQTAEEVATYLQKQGLKALAYHAGLPDDHRHAAQDGFMRGETQIIVATIAFGMGIDKANIRAVYHYNLPKTLENYMQETGRAGRDGADSLCELLACQDDLTVLENFVYGDTPTQGALRQLTNHLLRQGQEFDISLYDLSSSTDIRPLVIETVLTNLELEGLVHPLGAFYARYQYAFVQPEARILAGHKPERREFLRRLFACGERARKWTTLDPETAAEELGEPRERILKALTWLDEAGEIQLKPAGARQRYRLTEAARDMQPESVAASLQSVFERREERDVGRLNQIMELASQRECLVRWLLRYFGEEIETDCGRCTSCLERAAGADMDEPRPIPKSSRAAICQDDVVVMRGLLDARHASLRTARQLARFLCGISSPATSRARLTRNEAFGMLDQVPFAEVLAQAESMV